MNILVNTKTRSQSNRNSPSPSHTPLNITNSLLNSCVRKLNKEKIYKKTEEREKNLKLHICLYLFLCIRGAEEAAAGERVRVRVFPRRRSTNQRRAWGIGRYGRGNSFGPSARANSNQLIGGAKLSQTRLFFPHPNCFLLLS